MDEANVALSIVNPVIVEVIIALLIFFMGFVIGKIAQKLILQFFRLSELDKIFKKHTGMKVSLSIIASTVVSYFIYVVAIVMALNRLKIATTIITTIVILLILILILFVIFGLNDMFANFSAGLMLKIKGNIKQGDYIRIKDKHIEGYVVSVNSLSVRIETRKEEMVFIPNMALFRSEIVKPKRIKH
jgi:small-conductance mechanosensitive channel